MHRALQAYGEERGFRVAHRSKEKFCTPSSASLQQLPTFDGQQQVVSSPSTTSPLSDNDGSSPSVVDDGSLAARASHALSTCMARTSHALATGQARAKDASPTSQAQTFVVIHPPTAVNPPAIGSSPLIPIQGRTPYSIIQVTTPQPATPAPNSIRIMYRGSFHCEFAARPGEKTDKEEREEVRATRNTLTAKDWKKFCPGDRECLWRINYTYSKRNKTYSLAVKELCHQGHSFRSITTPDNTAVCLSTTFKDVTIIMQDKIREWLLMHIAGPQIRQVMLTYTGFRF
jgi:hypothetical protein